MHANFSQVWKEGNTYILQINLNTLIISTNLPAMTGTFRRNMKRAFSFTFICQTFHICKTPLLYSGFIALKKSLSQKQVLFFLGSHTFFLSAA